MTTNSDTEPKAGKMLYAFIHEEGLMEFPIQSRKGKMVWARDPSGRYSIEEMELKSTRIVVEADGNFFGLDADCVIQVARSHYAEMLAKSRAINRRLVAAEQHRARMRRDPSQRGGRRAGQRHQRQVVLDDETLLIWESFSGDRSAGIRHLMREYGIPVADDQEQPPAPNRQKKMRTTA